MKQRTLGSTRLCLEELEGRLVMSATVPSLTTSTNWSGYAVTSTAKTVSQVSGSWTVPTATGNGYSSVWVGIDGYNSSTVEQVGTESDILNGQTDYYAWYEMYPSYSVEIPKTVNPGDSISASVSYAAKTGFTMTITDSTSNWTYSMTKNATGAQRSSAEWIVEAPSSGYGILNLANFGTVNFTNAQATVGSSSGAINAVGGTLEEINMISPNSGATLDTTSALDQTGTSFSVTASTTTVTPTPPPRHHFWGWWETNQPGTTTTNSSTITTSTTTSTNLAFAQTLLGNTATQNNTTFASTTTTAVAALAGQTTSLPAFNPNTVNQPSHSTETGHLFVGGLDTLGDGSTPANTGSATPGERIVPEMIPAPMPMLNPGAGDDNQAQNLIWQPANDAVSDGRWDPATLQEISTSGAATRNDGTTLLVDNAGVLLTLTLSGSWTILSAEAAEYRRRGVKLR